MEMIKGQNLGLGRIRTLGKPVSSSTMSTDVILFRNVKRTAEISRSPNYEVKRDMG